MCFLFFLETQGFLHFCFSTTHQACQKQSEAQTSISVSFSSSTCLITMMHGEDITLAIAIEATDHLILRDLPNHVPVGPVPVSGVTPASLPLKELNPASTSVKHFFDIVWGVDSHAINVDNLKAVLRDKAWDELPEPLTLKERPTFRYISQFFLVPQVDGKICVVKHFYVLDDKIKGNCVAKLVRGQGHEVARGANNKVKTRKALQWDARAPGWYAVQAFCPQHREEETSCYAGVCQRRGARCWVGLHHLSW